LAESLWKFIRPDGDALSLDVFSRNASILVELSASAVDFIRILMPPKHLVHFASEITVIKMKSFYCQIDVCLEAQGIRIVNEADDDFILSFASQMVLLYVNPLIGLIHRFYNTVLVTHLVSKTIFCYLRT
jgi:hypothetical protein